LIRPDIAYADTGRGGNFREQIRFSGFCIKSKNLKPLAVALAISAPKIEAFEIFFIKFNFYFILKFRVENLAHAIVSVRVRE